MRRSSPVLEVRGAAIMNTPDGKLTFSFDICDGSSLTLALPIEQGPNLLIKLGRSLGGQERAAEPAEQGRPLRVGAPT
jgi:hypothetical protein